MPEYLLRIVDNELDELAQGLPAISLEGPKGVGKTATAQRRARTTFALDEPAVRELLAADPGRLDRAPRPVLVDEWQRHPAVWDWVRRSVDRDSGAGRFLLTGSATPISAPTHSGAGRIVRVRMRPMTLAERGLPMPTISLSELLSGEQAPVDGDTTVDLPIYAEEILRSGFPAIRALPPRPRRAQLDGYLARIVEHDFPEQGHLVRRPATLRAWLTAYAAATATTASYNAILDAATPGETDKPAKTTTAAYRDVLSQIWLLEPLPGWLPARNPFTRLARHPSTTSPTPHLPHVCWAPKPRTATFACGPGTKRPLIRKDIPPCPLPDTDALQVLRHVASTTSLSSRKPVRIRVRAPLGTVSNGGPRSTRRKSGGYG
ncbi:MAG: ATP-binding protein [Pseudonocardiaceae bacterium]